MPLFIGDLSDFHGAAYLRMNLAAFLLFFAVGGIAFLVSSLPMTRRKRLGISAVLTFGFFSLDFLGKLSEKIDWLRNLTYFSLYDPSGIIGGQAETALALAAIGCDWLGTFAAGIALFRKRDLPL